MLVTRLAKRYAKSLLELATENKKSELVKDDMALVAETIKQTHDLRVFLKSPVVDGSKKISVLKEVFKGQLDELTERFMVLMIKGGREGQLATIAEAYLQLYQKQNGIEKAVVTTANALTEEQRKDLSARLAALLGKQIQLEEKVDADMIGGMILRVDNKEYNGSISGKLNRLRKNFADNPYLPEF
jgi:F-type H+-transporting ATPase subunit delta